MKDIMICSECQSNKIIEDYKEGHLVCTDCGLVFDNHLIDSRPIYDTHRNIHFHPFIDNNQLDEHIERALDYLGIDNMLLHKEALNIMDKYKNDRSYTGHLQPLRAYSLLQSSKLHNYIWITQQHICEAFQINIDKLKVFFKDSANIDENNITPQSSIRKRLMNIIPCLMLPDNIKMKALNICEELEILISKNKLFKTKKPSKLDPVILYYTLTNRLKYKLKMTTFIKHLNLSIATLRKNLVFIETVLEPN